MSGIKALPVPGTANYIITFPNGETTTVKEKQLAQLLSKTGSSVCDFRPAVEQTSM